LSSSRETKQAEHDQKLEYLREAGYDIVADKAAKPLRDRCLLHHAAAILV
jgi:hypothetical protein